MISASVCTIGDEILIGQIVDTNSAHISKSLNSIGIKVSRILSISDDRDDICNSLSHELQVNDVVITTGGLGPTKDDITKGVLAELSHAKGWVMHEEQLAVVHRILHSRGLDVMPINIAQASVPDSCEVIVNRKGTAPILVFRLPEELFGHPVTLYSMPGVPFETLAALPEVLEDIKAHHELTHITHRNVMTFSLAESALAELIAPWENALDEDMHLAYLPNTLTGVKLRLSIYGGDEEDNQRRIAAKIEALKAILGPVIYAEEEDTMEHVLGSLLARNGKTMCAAESCTGGMISHLMTTIPGASTYYLGSVTSYANEVKTGVLGVSPETLEKFGAVSSETAAEMAEGVRKITGADYAVSTTGIAGPDGGTTEKPVGTCWIGVSSAAGTETAEVHFSGDRKRNIERFAASALDTLRKKVISELIN